MRKSSKFLWIALVVVAMLVVTTLGAMATDATTEIYGVADTVGGIGETFDVVFKYKNNNKNVECGKITLTWENDMSVVSISADEDVLGECEYAASVGEAVIAWAGSNIQSNVAEGELFTVTFQNNGMAAGELVKIAVEAEDFGTVSAFASNAITPTVNKVYATDGTISWNDTNQAQYETAEEFLEAVLGMANAGPVTVTLEKDMTFSADTEIENDKIPENTITITSENSTYGIVLQNKAIVTMYGQFEFRDIKYESGNSTDKGTLVFPDGCHGTFGYKTETDETTTVTYGGITTNVNALTNIGGNCTVYAGQYTTIAGNFKNSGIAIDAPTIIVCGDTNVQYVVGGSYDGGTVTGVSTVNLLDNAKVTGTIAGGGWYSFADGTGGANVTINTTNTVNRAVAATVHEIDEASTFNLTIESGSVTYVGGIYLSQNNARSVVDKLTVNITVNGGTISNYYGAALSATNASRMSIKGTFNTTINGGIFSYSFYGGSQLMANSTHEATTNLTITGGTFSSFVYGGSNVSETGAKHNGATTVTLDGKGNRKISLNDFLFGGSYLSAEEAEHIGNTKVILNAISSAASWRNDYNYDNFDMPAAKYIYGGSRHAKAKTLHSGSSVVELIRCDMRIDKWHCIGGSYFSAAEGEHRGTSAVIVNANKGLVDGVLTEDQNGVGYFYGSSFVGGSNIIGTGSGSKQTGKSSVQLIGPKDVSDTDVYKQLILYSYNGSGVRGVWGGDMFSDNVVTLQAHDSEVVIKNKIHTQGATDNSVQFFGGAKYGGVNYGSVTDDDSPVISTRVVVEGIIATKDDGNLNVFGGSMVKPFTSNKTFYQNSGVIVKEGGSVDGKIYLGCRRYNGSGSVVLDGDLLLEVDATATIDYGNVYAVVGTSTTHNGTKCFKLVGGEGEVTVSEFTNINFDILDLYRFTGNADSVNTIVNTVGAPTVYYPFVEGATIGLTGVATDGTTELVPGDELADRIPDTFKIDEYSYTYANLIAFDALSENDNAFVIYDANTQEILTKLPTHTKGVILGVGDLRTAEISFKNKFRITAATLQFGSNLGFSIKINATDLEDLGYTDFSIVATLNGVETSLVSDFEKDSKGRYEWIFNDIPAYLMAHDITFRLQAKNGNEECYNDTIYGVYVYCRNQWAKETISDEFRTAIVDMLLYGNATQVYASQQFGVDYTTLLATDAAGLSADDIAKYGTSDLRELVSSTDKNYEKIDETNIKASFAAVNLRFNSAVEVVFRFIPNSTVDVSKLKIKVQNIDSDPISEWTFNFADFTDAGYDNDGNWKGYTVILNGLNADEMSDVILATVWEDDTLISNTLSYSIESYAESKQNNANSALASLVQTMIKYGDSIVEYVKTK